MKIVKLVICLLFSFNVFGQNISVSYPIIPLPRPLQKYSISCNEPHYDYFDLQDSSTYSVWYESSCRPFHYYVYQNNKLDRALEFNHFCQRIDGTYWQMDTAEQARIIVEFKIIEPNIQIQNLINRDAVQEMENILKISYAEIDTLSNNRILGSTKLKNGMIPNDKISETYFSEGVVNSQLLWDEGVYQRIYYYPNGNIKAKVGVEPHLRRSEFITFDPITFAEIIEYKSDFVPVREGDYQSFHKNGKTKITGIYTKGYKVGKWKEYSFDSILMVDALYDTSALGEIVFYYSNGEKQAKGKAYASYESASFEGDSKEGTWHFYYENGQLKEKMDYKGNVKVGACAVYYENGKLAEKGYTIQLIDKIDLGDGQPPIELPGKTVKDGLWEYYGENGKLIKKELYKEGVLQ